jgi:hypothetical protein
MSEREQIEKVTNMMARWQGTALSYQVLWREMLTDRQQAVCDLWWARMAGDNPQQAAKVLGSLIHTFTEKEI